MFPRSGSKRSLRGGLGLLFTAVALAQTPAPPAPATIELGACTVDTSKLENRLQTDWSSAEHGQRWLLLLERPLDGAMRAGLHRAGVVVLDIVSPHGLVVNLDHATETGLSGLGFIRWLGEYREAFKLDPSLATASGAEPLEVEITLFRNGSEREVLDGLRVIAGASFLSRHRSGAKERIWAALPPGDMSRLAALAAVQSLGAIGRAQPASAPLGCGGEDADADGVGDACDNCGAVPNPGQEDGDLPCTCCSDLCNHPSCKALVCAINPNCCGSAWGSTCKTTAQAVCGCCLGPDGVGDACDNCPAAHNPGQEDTDVACNCCAGGDLVGCDDDTCEATVCGVDPFCCDTEWDVLCDEQAGALCACCAGGGDGVGNDCDLCPKDVDPRQQDGDADGVGDVCDNCPENPNKNQFESDKCACCSPGPNCGDLQCIGLVCGADPFCCQVQWDEACAEQAEQVCSCCDGDGFGDACDNCPDVINPGQENSDPACNCCAGGDGTGCNDDACEASICSHDPSCCSDRWDAECDGAAAALCGCCAPDPDGDACDNCPHVFNPDQDDDDPDCNCCTGGDGLGCDDEVCEATVCGLDSFCCNVAWDGICNGEAVCACSCCNPGDGVGDACDNCPGIPNPGGAPVLFGQTIVALGTKSDFGWPKPADYAFVRGDFVTTGDIGSYEFRVFEFDSGAVLHDETSPPEGGGLWYLLRPACHAGSWSSGGPGEVPGADAALP